MATARKRSSVSTTVPKTVIEQVTLTLQELPEKTKDTWSLREAIEHLQETIKAALDKGYSHEEVASMLTDRGVEINASSLKYHLSAAKRRQNSSDQPKGKRTRRVKKKSASSDAEPTPVSAEATDRKSESTGKKGIAGVISYLMSEPQTSSDNSVNGSADTNQANGSTAESATADKKRTTRTSTRGKTKSETAKPAAKTRTAAKTKSSSRSTSTKTSSRSTSTRSRKNKETA